MADALVEQGPTARFFCHRCNIEFEDVLQDYTCPFCASGFIEQLENVSEGQGISGDDFSDADMSNIDDTNSIDDVNNWEDLEDVPRNTTPLLGDLAFFIAGNRTRRNLPRRHTLMEELVLMMGGTRPGPGAVAVGPPFVFIGAPGDYVLGGEGLDAVVSQLLGQLENTGPPPLPREQLIALPNETVSCEQAAANTTCSICWENFLEGESASRLVCEHVFHSACIRPWLQLHATCPICRRSLLPEVPPAVPRNAPQAAPQPAAARRSSLSRVLVRRIPRLQATRPQILTRNSLGDMSSSSSSSTSTTSSVTAGGVWAPRSATNSTGTNSTTSLNSSNDRERQYNMDIDYD